MASISDKVEDRIEGIAGKVLGKLLPKRLSKMSLTEQVGFFIKMSGMMGMPTVRRDILKDRGLPSDIKDMLKVGKTREEIKAYYWDCDAFRKFWQDMEMTEDTLDFLIDQATKG